jgi:mRNA interferase MazF
MAIKAGDIYWLKAEDPAALATAIRHPRVVVQDPDDSGSQTVLTCELTSNLKRVSMPGNVLLNPGEANLERQSVVQVGKLAAVDQSQLGEYIGTLSVARVEQILAGLKFLQRGYYPR